MANIASQKKRIARTERERQENRHFAGSVKTQMKKLEQAVTAGDDAAADAEHKLLVSRVDKAIQKGAVHKNTGARKKARAARLRSGEVKPVATKAARPAKPKPDEPEAAEAAEPASEEAADE
jgi:small subunit ribosomal protein S20